MRAMARLRLRDEAGQNLVEFAVVISAFLLIILGVIDLGRAVFEYNLIANSAREGARVAIIQGNTNDCVLKQVVDSSATLLTAGGTPSCTGVATMCTALPCTKGDVTISATGNTRSCTSLPCGTVTVSVSHTFTVITPLISNIAGNTLTLSSSSTMVVER